MKFTDKRFCVYFYLNTENNRIIYVGHGSYSRPKELSCRHEAIKTLHATDKLKTIIAFDMLTKSEAEDIENQYLTEYIGQFKDGFDLLNKRYPATSKDIKYSHISEYVYFDSNSPTLLRWKKDIRGCYNTLRKKDSVAGGFCKTKGYGSVHICGRAYKLHRILFCLYHECDLEADFYIDHADGDKANNTRQNLRRVTAQENRFNTPILVHKSDNSSGRIGVKKATGKKGSPFWIAEMKYTMSGQRFLRSKKFSIAKYGNDEAFKLACEAREQFEKDLKG